MQDCRCRCPCCGAAWGGGGAHTGSRLGVRAGRDGGECVWGGGRIAAGPASLCVALPHLCGTLLLRCAGPGGGFARRVFIQRMRSAGCPPPSWQPNQPVWRPMPCHAMPCSAQRMTSQQRLYTRMRAHAHAHTCSNMRWVQVILPSIHMTRHGRRACIGPNVRRIYRIPYRTYTRIRMRKGTRRSRLGPAYAVYTSMRMYGMYTLYAFLPSLT